MFLDLIPPGWIRDYCLVMEEANNEMPMPFHFLAASTLVGNALGLRTWGTLSRSVRIYPNINAILLSPAGRARRGEGTKIAERVARRAGLNVFSGKITPEGLADELVGNGDLFFYVEELPMLFTKQEFQRPIIPLLTKFLLHGEGPSEYRTRGSGRRIPIPYINLSALFTCAPDWFMTTIPEEAFGGGLLSRFLVCCLDDRETFHIDITVDDADSTIVRALADGLTTITRRTDMQGHIAGDAGAQEWIEPWYKENESAMVDDDRMSPHRNRKPANLLRLAIILSAASGGNGKSGRLLRREDLACASELLDWFEPTLARLYGITDALGSIIARGERRILTKLSGGEMQHSELVRSCASYFKGGVQEMRRALDGLMEKQLVKATYTGAVKAWPPRSWAIIVEEVGGGRVK